MWCNNLILFLYDMSLNTGELKMSVYVMCLVTFFCGCVECPWTALPLAPIAAQCTVSLLSGAGIVLHIL
jgi:hypothetical protein